MNGQRTVKYVLSISLVILLCGNLRAGPTFRDDFSDGNVQDGAPVSWGWDDDGLGERLVTPEGFRLVPNPDMIPSAVVLDDEGNDALYAGNVMIRMQLRMDSPLDWGNTGVYFRAARTGDWYMAGIILNQLFLGRLNNGTWTVLSQPTIPGFSPTGQDIIIEIDVTDFTNATGQRTSQLEVYCWFPGQTKPAQPRISVVDDTFTQGTIVLYAQRCSVTFRWVEVFTEPTPTEPVVDFNGDGTVDIDDLLRLIESWGQDDPTVDIVSDGVVDKKDLEVLMDYWQQDVNDPTLAAHWALDETEGSVAYDSVGLTPGTVLGGAVWRPDAGQLEGALEFDGVDDVITAGAVVNPSKGPFSVLAWVKGGAPGQVIFSQTGGVNPTSRIRGLEPA